MTPATFWRWRRVRRDLARRAALSGRLMGKPRHPVLVGLERGARGRCPHCGQGRLFRAYLKIIPICPVCGHDNGQYPAADSPPYFTILIVGHLVVVPMLAFRFILIWPAGVLLAIVLPVVATLTLTLLPIVKGAVVGVLWALGRPTDS